MRTIATTLILAHLGGCATVADPNYMAQLDSYRQTIMAQQSVELARARAEEARYQAMAAIAERSDAQTKSMAILALALGGRSDITVKSTEVQLPRIPETAEDRALRWASVIVPTVATLGLGYWGYRTAVSQSNNQAQTTQASYNALVAFKPQPMDWSKIPPTTQTITTTTTTNTNNNDITNRDGFVVTGGQAPTNPTQDNSVRPIAVVPPVFNVPVVVVPPVVPIVPVITGP